MTVAVLREGLGAALALCAWRLPRRVAAARATRLSALLLDAFPVAFGAFLLLSLSARPLFSIAVIVFAKLGGAGSAAMAAISASCSARARA